MKPDQVEALLERLDDPEQYVDAVDDAISVLRAQASWLEEATGAKGREIERLQAQLAEAKNSDELAMCAQNAAIKRADRAEHAAARNLSDGLKAERELAQIKLQKKHWQEDLRRVERERDEYQRVKENYKHMIETGERRARKEERRLRDERDEAIAAIPSSSGRDENRADEELGNTSRHHVGREGQTSYGCVDATRAKRALVQAYAEANALRARLDDDEENDDDRL